MPEGCEYHKINSIYRRNTVGSNKGKFIIGQYSIPEFEYLKNNEWEFTEKVDGTNIRIIWDGENVSFGGRTDSAQLYVPLLNKLREITIPERFKEVFDGPAVVYGEGYGSKIQKGGENYIPDGVGFVAFDVRIGRWWLKQEDARGVSEKLGFTFVPFVCCGTLPEIESRVALGFDSKWGKFPAEGVVGRPVAALLTRSGERIIVKLKTRDFVAPLDRNGV